MRLGVGVVKGFGRHKRAALGVAGDASATSATGGRAFSTPTRRPSLPSPLHAAPIRGPARSRTGPARSPLGVGVDQAFPSSLQLLHQHHHRCCQLLLLLFCIRCCSGRRPSAQIDDLSSVTAVVAACASIRSLPPTADDDVFRLTYSFLRAPFTSALPSQRKAKPAQPGLHRCASDSHSFLPSTTDIDTDTSTHCTFRASAHGVTRLLQRSRVHQQAGPSIAPARPPRRRLSNPRQLIVSPSRLSLASRRYPASALDAIQHSRVLGQTNTTEQVPSFTSSSLPHRDHHIHPVASSWSCSRRSVLLALCSPSSPPSITSTSISIGTTIPSHPIPYHTVLDLHRRGRYR